MMNLQEALTRKRYTAIFIVIAAVAAHAPTLSAGFVWDDVRVFFGASDYIPFFENFFHRPLYEVSMALDHWLWGETPLGFHATNVLLHAAVSLLVFVLGLQIFGSTVTAALAALLFALHPVNTEAVAWVPARADLLMALFFLTAFSLYLHYDKEKKTSSLMAGALFFLLAALSRQTALVFPLMVLLYESSVREREPLDGKKISIYTVSLALPLVLFLAFFRGTGEFFPAGGLAFERLSDSLSAFGYYMVKLMVPVHLGFLPKVPAGMLYVIIALLPLVLLAVLYSEKKKLSAFLTAWVLITLLPSLLIPMSNVEFPIGERFLYLPAAGFCLLLAAALGSIRSRKILAACLVPLFALYTAGTFAKALTWADTAALWQDTARKNPDRALPHLHHAMALVQEGSLKEGGEALKKALRDDGITQDELLLAMKLFGSAGEGAEEQLLDVLVEERGEAQAYYGLGFMQYTLYFDTGSGDPSLLEKAVGYFERAVAAAADFVPPHYYLGVSYLELGDWENAETQLKITEKLDSNGRYKAQTADFLKLIGLMREQGLSNRRL